MVGGYVVRDRGLRSLNGRYVYADLCAGELRSFVGLDGARKDRAVRPTVPSPTSFGEGAGGRICVASHGGRVWKLMTAPALRGGALAAAIVALAILAPGSAAGAISANEVGISTDRHTSMVPTAPAARCSWSSGRGGSR